MHRPGQGEKQDGAQTGAVCQQTLPADDTRPVSLSTRDTATQAGTERVLCRHVVLRKLVRAGTATAGTTS